MRILLAEDEKQLSDNIAALLKHEQYQVIQAFDGEEALDLLYSTHVDLLLLDIMMPKLNGIELIKMVRETGNDIPTLMLTASNMIESRVDGLDAGADDYLCKPFSNLELLARIRSLLRRHNSQKSSLIHYADLVLDMHKGVVTKSGLVLELTAKEYKLIVLFLNNIGTVLTRLQLNEYLWGDMTTERSNNAIDAHIKNVRKKIGTNIIQTVHAVGYIVKKELS
ncbi:MAG: response regulator transcription factor [Epsilonproteobacteria bacterium]|nr:response regulator transcription factor [Campylobacterota bacterium]